MAFPDIYSNPEGQGQTGCMATMAKKMITTLIVGFRTCFPAILNDN